MNLSKMIKELSRIHSKYGECQVVTPIMGKLETSRIVSMRLDEDSPGGKLLYLWSPDYTLQDFIENKRPCDLQKKID